MQNKALIYGLGVIVLAIIAVGTVTLLGKGAADQTANVTDAGVAESTSLKDLLARGDARSCTFSSVAQGTQSSGTVYVAGGKLRGDFTTISSGQTLKTHMVVSNDLSYIWSDDDSIPAFYVPFNGEGGEGSQGIDASAKMEYTCTLWSATENTFALPKDVTFQAIQ